MKCSENALPPYKLLVTVSRELNQMSQARDNYLSKIAHDIYRHSISPALTDSSLPCLTLANFLELFQDIRLNDELGGHRQPKYLEMQTLLESLNSFDSLRIVVIKLKDYPVFNVPLTSDEETILKESEKIMRPIERFIEQRTQPQSAILSLPLNALLERREPSEVEVAEAQSELSCSEDRLAEQEEQSARLLQGFRGVKTLILELRDAYFSRT
jgi:hypothetical protein